jgi:hypothetical protein
MIDNRDPDGLAWTRENRVRALAHGETRFREPLTAIEGR